ncbi:MAG: hypothetical protein R3B84_16695 [Zavarzinella sp.]
MLAMVLCIASGVPIAKNCFKIEEIIFVSASLIDVYVEFQKNVVGACFLTLLNVAAPPASIGGTICHQIVCARNDASMHHHKCGKYEIFLILYCKIDGLNCKI